MNKILIVDDDVAICRSLQLHFINQGYDVEIVNSAEEGLKVELEFDPSIIILDIRMKARSGLEALPDFKRRFKNTRVIIITAYHDMESTIQAMQRGADDYIHKPIDLEELDNAVTKALFYQASERDDEQVVASAVPTDSGFAMVGQSHSMKEIFKIIGRIASTPATVLITGESGTGKELVARAIHKAGDNPDGPFVAINCAALVETLLESEMFGHEKGAFTGAISAQTGKFALAKGGTILLDEVAELSASMQAKLLRVLQEKEFIPLGAKKIEKLETRVITATNRDLLEFTKEGNFREDLYYRLQVVNIHLPPLRDRIEDISVLVDVMLSRINRDMHRNVVRVAKDALEALHQYDWPGNVRELENALTKAVALCPSNTITMDLLPPHIQSSQNSNLASDEARLLGKCSLHELEKVHVAKVLKNTAWHKGKACDILGVSRPRLRRLIAQYKLQPPEGIADPANDVAGDSLSDEDKHWPEE